MQRSYWMQLFGNLVNASPVDTRNMVTHINLYETEDTYEIEVAAPYATNPKSKKTIDKYGNTDYAYLVNTSGIHTGWIERQMVLTENVLNSFAKYKEKEK